MKIAFGLFMVSLFFFDSIYAQKGPLWMQYPAISPDGRWIVFEYQGDLFKVSSSGGVAIPLTMTKSYERSPVWSHDGKKIAFASDRYGNFDIYVMSSSGGPAKRLTFNSALDIPYDFSPNDKQILFGTTRHDIYTSVRYPLDFLFKKLYEVPVLGGRSLMINSAGMEYAHLNSQGNQIVFQDRKGFEDSWRKHDTSSVTRDIWIYDFKLKKYTRISPYKGEDREPVWGNADTIYYLSEREGDQNLFQTTLAHPRHLSQLTYFTRNPVRNLSRSLNGIMAFTQNGEIYTLKMGSKPQVVFISIHSDFGDDLVESIPVKGGATEMVLSPNNKEIAIVYRGEIFVTSVEGGISKRITNTPYQERMVQFSSDGRSLLYSVEKDSSWDIYQTTIVKRNEPYFYSATELKTESLIAGPHDEYQGIYSPDGKKIAYLYDRNILKAYNLKTKKSVTIVPEGVNYSYADGDQCFNWSPDSKYLLVNSQEGSMNLGEIDMVSADGEGKRVNLTRSGFVSGNAKWGLNGKMMYYYNGMEGMRNLSTNAGGEGDVYAMFFDPQAFKLFQLSKPDLDLWKAEHKDSTKVPKILGLQKWDSLKKASLWVPDLKDLDDRTIRLTINSTLLQDYILSPDGEKLYYLSSVVKGSNIWITEHRTHNTKILAMLPSGGSDLQMSKGGKFLFLLAGGNIQRVNAETGQVTQIPINARMYLNLAGERKYIFEHVWRQMKEKLFDPDMNGVDWDYFHRDYVRFLPFINNNYDFRILLSEMLGELNVSHTGGRYYPRFPEGDATAALGLLYNEMKGGKGLEIEEVLKGGPLDVHSNRIRKGDYLEKIDGIQIDDSADWAILLNHKDGHFTSLDFLNPGNGRHWDETIKPITAASENRLLYLRWTRTMARITDSLSGGKVGYVDVESMNESSFRRTVNRVLGRNEDEKALIMDTRFNGGGNLHDELITFLTGKPYLHFAPQGHMIKGDGSPIRWDKPSCVLISQCNYSDAFMFPYIYKELHIGKLIGMPVPGTGTFVWWERQIDPTLIFGMPMISTFGIDAIHNNENVEVEPDIRVDNPYNDLLSGWDDQLAAAVRELMKETKGK